MQLRPPLRRQRRRGGGGGLNAFSRYENGKTKPPLALVKILRRHLDLLAEVNTA